MNKHLSTFILSLVSTIVLAQEPAQKSVSISIGGGKIISSSSLKQNTQLGDGHHLGGNVFVSLFRKGWDGTVKGGRIDLGIIAGGDFNAGKSLTPDPAAAQAIYKLTTGNLAITSASNGADYSKGFAGFAGLQADISLGKVVFSPSLSGGYFSLTRDGFNQSSQVSVNGTSQSIVLLAAPKVKTTGFLTKPQLKISYPLTRNLSIYTAGAVNLGPKVDNTRSYLTPSGGFNPKGTYEPQQLTSGKMTLSGDSKDPGYVALSGDSKDAGYKTVTINAGLSWNFGGTSSARRLRGKVIKTGDNGAMPANKQAGVAGGFVPEAGILSKATLFARPGQPISGIAVKGGKNPGGSLMTTTTNTKGEFEFTVTEAGNYLFKLTAPEQAANSQKTGNPLYEHSGSEAQNPLYEPNSFVASPGSPIGGIVVKGGKNPGGNMMTITTNTKGELKLRGLAPGNYLFTVTAPMQPVKKSISEKGIK